MHIGLTGFAELTVMRYLFASRGFVSRRCICSFNGDDARALIALQSSLNRASLPTLTRGRT